MDLCSKLLLFIREKILSIKLRNDIKEPFYQEYDYAKYKGFKILGLGDN